VAEWVSAVRGIFSRERSEFESKARGGGDEDDQLPSPRSVIWGASPDHHLLGSWENKWVRIINSFSAIDDYNVNVLLARHMPSADKFFRSPMSNYLFRAESINCSAAAHIHTAETLVVKCNVHNNAFVVPFSDLFCALC
jgi:hypothetical protein